MLLQVEVRLEKLVNERWPELTATNIESVVTSSRHGEWDQIAKEVEKDEEESESNGVDKLFQV